MLTFLSSGRPSLTLFTLTAHGASEGSVMPTLFQDFGD
jgi:hypothetical protein